MQRHSSVYRYDAFRAVQAWVQTVPAPIPDIRRVASILCTLILVDVFTATIKADDLIEKVLAIEAYPSFIWIILQNISDFIL